MNRYVESMEAIRRELARDIENLKRLAEAIPQLLERRQAQLDRLAEVASSMQQEDTEVEALIARYTDMRPSKVRSRRRGQTLPADILSLLHEAGPGGASLDELHEGLSRIRHVSKQNLSSTLSRMKSQGRIAKADGMFIPAGEDR